MLFSTHYYRVSNYFLLQEKSGNEKNSKFSHDFKTLSDVLIQETVRHDLGKQYPNLAENIRVIKPKKKNLSNTSSYIYYYSTAGVLLPIFTCLLKLTALIGVISDTSRTPRPTELSLRLGALAKNL